MALITQYEKWYESDEYFWGTKEAELCHELIKLVPPSKDIKVLDIGCGEGKDAVYMAKQGYTVYAFDVTKSGIAKTQRLADYKQALKYIEVLRTEIIGSNEKVQKDPNKDKTDIGQAKDAIATLREYEKNNLLTPRSSYLIHSILL